jgi:hypothetical protein
VGEAVRLLDLILRRKLAYELLDEYDYTPPMTVADMQKLLEYGSWEQATRRAGTQAWRDVVEDRVKA